MAKTTLPAHQERSRQSLLRLLKSTVEVLNKKGLEAATIPRIAAGAGLTPGAIYRRFPDKDALLREVFLRMLEENFQQTNEMLKPERWQGKSLTDLCEYIIDVTLRGHLLYRGLLRAYALFTLHHPDTAFVRKSEKLEARTLQAVSSLLLSRRSEIRHPDPESAVPFALLMVGLAAQGALVLPRDPRHFSDLMPDFETRLKKELPRMVLSYLGVKR
jgi:AcrR family transcriptional regulator